MAHDKTSKDFCVYLPALRKVVVRREVRFEEERGFRKSREEWSGGKEEQIYCWSNKSHVT